MNYTEHRKPNRRLLLRRGVPCEQALEALDGAGELLKASAKSRTTRHGRWVVKASVPNPVAALRHTLLRRRCRRGWAAAWHFERSAVGAPRPIAYAETGRWGVITAHALILEYLGNHPNVERFYSTLIEGNAGAREREAYFVNLAGAVRRLCESGAYHADLSGKNILTQDGRRFAFIDLDSVLLTSRYTRARRMKNHVQLYDSFCDMASDTLLADFLRLLAPGGMPFEAWFEEVKRRQAKRRARTAAIWKKQGRVPPPDSR